MFSPIHVFPYHFNVQQIPINPLKVNQHPNSSPQKNIPLSLEAYLGGWRKIVQWDMFYKTQILYIIHI